MSKKFLGQTAIQVSGVVIYLFDFTLIPFGSGARDSRDFEQL